MLGASSRSNRLTRVSAPASRSFGVAVVVAIAVAISGCDRPPAPTREWTPQDHDRADESARVSSGAQASAQPRSSASPADETRALVAITWQRQCATCHGATGHGDGPQGPMVKATNLASEEWQAKVTDADIATAIKLGKGQMPKFDLPNAVIVGLVEQIRALRGR